MHVSSSFAALLLLVPAFGVLASEFAPSPCAHDLDGNTIFVAPVPDQTMTGEVVLATLIGPPSGSTVVHAELSLNFTTNGAVNAADVQLDFGLSLDGVGKHWLVSGSDLGWGSGSGTFSGTIATDDFFGQIGQGFLPGASVISLDIHATTGGVWGQFTNSELRLTLNQSLKHDVPEVSLANGGTQTLELNAGPVNAGGIYFLLGSTSGQTPGFSFDGVLVPLMPDPYFTQTLAQPNVPPFSNSFGTLDGAGKATAQITLPAGSNPALAGYELHHAYVLLEFAPLGLTYSSNPSMLRLVP